MTQEQPAGPGTTFRDWAIRLVVAALATVLTALLGPFTTYEQYSFGMRLAYWGGLIFGVLLPAYGLQWLVHRFVRGPILRVDLTSAVVIALGVGAMIWMFNITVMGFDLMSARALGEHILITFLICIVPVAVRAHIRADLKEGVSAPSPVAEPAFLRRLDPDVRGVVLSVSADDHQLHVQTDRGRSRLRMRFADALNELKDMQGVRVHRSHWVAYDAIRSAGPDGRRYKVTLHCGQEFPVSQSGAEQLRAVGLLAS